MTGGTSVLVFWARHGPGDASTKATPTTGNNADL
jgi:hypothetical protein